MSATVLRVEDLSLAYHLGKQERLDAVRSVSLELQQGRILGLAGESGSGKSTLARALIGWRDANAVVVGGGVAFDGLELLKAPAKQLRRVWGRHLAYVPQDVGSALNPARRIGAQLDEPLRLHTQLSERQRKERIGALLDRVRMPSDREALARYPFEFSGGQQQRLALALAMLCEPDVLVLDEPTTGIDASLRTQVFAVLRDLLRDRDTAVVYISHDLAEIASVADDLAVMYAGEIVEYGTAEDVFTDPLHPYAAALRAAIPGIEDDVMVEGIPGRPPAELMHEGCSFAPRCSYVTESCLSGRIELVPVRPGRLVRCIRVTADNLHSREVDGTPLIRQPLQESGSLLAVHDLTCSYSLSHGRKRAAVSDMTLGIAPGETLGIVGESGSGKSTLLRAIVGLHTPESGEVLFQGAPLAAHTRKRTAEQHRNIQLVFQNPDRSLNPKHTVARILTAPLLVYEPELSGKERRTRIGRLLEQVQLAPSLAGRLPRQLSGGERQRVALARAFAARPRVLLCDEVVSALDVSVQATIKNLLRTYTTETGAAVIFVSHDLAVVRMMSDRIMVMRSGVVCEEAQADELFRAPQHPFTRELVAALPSVSKTAHDAGHHLQFSGVTDPKGVR